MHSSVGSATSPIVRMIGEGISHDEQAALIHGHLRVIILLKTSVRRIFHDTRLRVGLGKDTARCLPFGPHVSASSPPNLACKLSLHQALPSPSPDRLSFFELHFVLLNAFGSMFLDMTFKASRFKLLW